MTGTTANGIRSRVWAVLTSVAVVVLAGCGGSAGAGNEPGTSRSSATGSSVAESSATTSGAGQSSHGQPEEIQTIVAVVDGNIVAVGLAGDDTNDVDQTTDTRDAGGSESDGLPGSARIIANGSELSQALGVQGHVEGLDLSPDGKRIIFTFGGAERDRASYRLYSAAVDGSDAPIELLAGKPDDEFVGAVRFSPDGQYVAVADGAGLSIFPIDANWEGASGSVPLPYPPMLIQWSPDAGAVAWLEHSERTDCCSISTASVGPSGVFSMKESNVPVSGSPWFDEAGEIRSNEQFTGHVDTDSSYRWAVALRTDDDESTQVLWWDTAEPESPPQALSLPVEIDPYSPIAW